MKKRCKDAKKFIAKSNKEALEGYLRLGAVKAVEVLPAGNAGDACGSSFDLYNNNCVNRV